MEEYHVAYIAMQVGVEEKLLERLTINSMGAACSYRPSVPCDVGSARSNATSFMKGHIYIETPATT
jgi:hypothetical protein